MQTSHPNHVPGKDRILLNRKGANLFPIKCNLHFATRSFSGICDRAQTSATIRPSHPHMYDEDDDDDVGRTCKPNPSRH